MDVEDEQGRPDERKMRIQLRDAKREPASCSFRYIKFVCKRGSSSSWSVDVVGGEGDGDGDGIR